VAKDLKARLDAQQTGNPFETKAWNSEDMVVRSPTVIDFAEVPDYGRIEPRRMGPTF
jgi:hypothetical protein